MTAHVRETILRSFRLKPESLRDLDAIIRERSKDVDPTFEPEYTVSRKDNYSFKTKDIEEVIRERNGKDTALQELGLIIGDNQKLRLTLEFSYRGVHMDGMGEDRAKFLVLTTDVRTLVRESMAGRSSRRLPPGLSIVGLAILFAVGMFAYFGISQAIYESWDSQRDQSVAQYELDSQQRRDEIAKTVAAAVANARSANASGSPEEQVKALLNLNLVQVKAEEDRDTISQRYPDFISRPWWMSSFFMPFAVGIAVSVLGWIVGRLVYRSPESTFLIGDGIDRQQASDARRDKLLWGIVIALVVGIISSIVAARIFGA